LSHEILETTPEEKYDDEEKVYKEAVMQSFYKGISMFVCSFGILLGGIHIQWSYFMVVFSQISIGVYIYS